MLLFAMQVLVMLSAALAQDKFYENCLKAHNYYRGKHGAPPLRWNKLLADDAQKWANQLAREDELYHDYNTMETKEQGENLAYLKPPRQKCQGEMKGNCVQCSDIVRDWYSEVKNYNFANGRGKSPSSVVLHFTPVVWKASKELGVGTALSKKYGFIAVARYSPRGNIGSPEQYKKNIQPAGTTNPAPKATEPVPQSKPTLNPDSAGPPSSSTRPPSGRSENVASSKCKYYIINSTTTTYKMVQECQGKPNITIICPGGGSTTVCNVLKPGTSKPQTSKPATSPTASSPQPTKPASTMKTPSPSSPQSTKPASTVKTPSPSSPQSTKPVSSKPTTAKPTKAKPGLSKDEMLTALMLTNLYRTRHQSPPIKWNAKLAGDAQKWADKLTKRDSGLTHDVNITDGENLAEMPANDKAVVVAIDTWYDEVNKYNFKNHTFSKDTGHFTQLVWKRTTDFGVGLAKTKDGSKVMVIARFRPAGNVEAQFEHNVLPIPPKKAPGGIPDSRSILFFSKPGLNHESEFQ